MNRPQVGVGVIIKKDNSVLLGMREKKFGFGKLCLPGGHLEMFETTEEAGRRETLEECGLKIGKMELIGFTEDFHKNQDKHYITIFYLGQYINGEPIEMEPDKISNWQWYPIDQLNSPIVKKMLWAPCIDKFKLLGWMK